MGINNSPQPQLPVNLPPWIQKGVPQYGRLKIEIEGTPRHFVAWFWEERIYFQDKECPRLIWATLDKWDETISLGEFWREAIRTRNVGRYVEIRHSFEHLSGTYSSPCYSGLSLSAFPLCVLVDEQGGGVASLKGSKRWHEFDAYTPPRIARPKAWVPSIFSPRRHFKLVRPALRPLIDELLCERLSFFPWAVWKEGATYAPLNMVSIVLQIALGANALVDNGDVRKIWQKTPHNPALLELVGLGSKTTRGWFSCSKYGATYAVIADGFHIKVALPVAEYSNHELMEAFRELGDWLHTALPPTEAKRYMTHARLA